MADEEKEKSGEFSFHPQFAGASDKFKGAAGRFQYSKDLGDNASLAAYADAMLGQAHGQNPFAKLNNVGVTYTKRFAKGGAVKSASIRADGIATKGKTRGRYI